MELPDPVRQRLGNFSRTVFSDSSRTGPEYNEGPETRPFSGRRHGKKLWFFFNNETVSSLALQMSLYFNTYFFPLWWVSSIMMLQMKVPELAGFWLLSLLLQLPLILFLLFNEGLTNLPLEKAVHIIFTMFLTFQVVSAFLTLRKMVNQLATRFHLQEFDWLSVSRGDMRRVRSCIEEI
ncbi:transmembrane protein 17 isoform X3 [Hippopotamus amphibius kiboko]|uniref:transmembrane protein 17 isoform X3 n=1 Tax=Hippopotamus amphibius kiboko TaxID=575201 RepID=UPI00259389A8|nr:transmembrane protein 17 isoform X3 [Hippopotamus amphibius kiboko]